MKHLYLRRGRYWEIGLFEEVKIEGKPILVIAVPEGKDKPYQVKDRGVFVRSGGTDRIATRYELDEFYKRRSVAKVNNLSS